jgi:hypothetical protein
MASTPQLDRFLETQDADLLDSKPLTFALNDSFGG